MQNKNRRLENRGIAHLPSASAFLIVFPARPGAAQASDSGSIRSIEGQKSPIWEICIKFRSPASGWLICGPNSYTGGSIG
jgi:hypothetical protein